MAGYDADPFLTAVDEDEDADVMDEHAVSMCCPMPPHLAADQQPLTVKGTPTRKPGRPKKGATENAQPPTKRTRCGRPKQKLSALEPKSDVELMPTFFATFGQERRQAC